MARIIFAVQPDDKTRSENDQEIFARDVKAGLSAEQKYIPAAYHYDAEGSRLFNMITELPEYYLTRCEIDVLKRNKRQIADLMTDGPVNLIEFGPGDGSKTRTLIDFLLRGKIDFRYAAMDVSHAALKQLAHDYKSRFPGLLVDCLVANYYTDRKLLKEHYRNKNLVLFLGSSIGNLDPTQTGSFIQGLRQDLNDGDLVIIGFDLIKQPELVRKAYNDSQGVTAAFNLNLLERINRELDGDFDLSKFRYAGIYDSENQVVRSYLVSLEKQDVYIGALKSTFHFHSEESIHTEDSYKFRETDIERLADRHGFDVKGHLYDSQGFFVDSIWEACNS